MNFSNKNLKTFAKLALFTSITLQTVTSVLPVKAASLIINGKGQQRLISVLPNEEVLLTAKLSEPLSYACVESSPCLWKASIQENAKILPEEAVFPPREIPIFGEPDTAEFTFIKAIAGSEVRMWDGTIEFSFSEWFLINNKRVIGERRTVKGDFTLYVGITDGGTSVPEPLTILGSLTALGIGITLKKRQKKVA